MAMFSKRRSAAAAAALVLLGGCNTLNNSLATPADAFGESVKHNAAVHIIDPEPVYEADSSQPGDRGDHAADASKRYRAGAVKEVESVQTQSGGSGGGSR
jgi:hypothetical protein